jgi:hypothetical protein
VKTHEAQGVRHGGPQARDHAVPVKSVRVMNAVMTMKKFDLAALQRAYSGHD